MPFRITLALSGLVFTACSTKESAPAASPAAPEAAPAAAPKAAATQVTVYGALREMMHENRLERRVDLGPMIGRSGLYGLGALENLSGEVTIWDGQVWLSKPDGAGGATAGQVGATEDGAALLVTANVTAWQEQRVDEAVPFDQLDAFIEGRAKAAGIDIAEAFPWRIVGAPSRIDWHVIDGSKIPSTAHGHEAHMRTAVRGKLAGKTVQILGFTSPKHHTIFTHHDTNTPAHVIAGDEGVTGHVDHMDLAPGATLYLPKP